MASLRKGSVSLAQSTLDFGTGLWFSATSPFDEELQSDIALNPEARFEAFDEMRIRIDGVNKEYDELITQFDRTASETFVDGDWGEFAHNVLIQTAGALPSLAATATGIGGMIVLGASAAGGAFVETLEEAEDSSLWSILGTSVAKGGFEFASEYVTRGILKKAGLLFSKGGKPAINAYAGRVAKEVFKDFGSEGLGESGASLAGYILDYVVHGIEPPDNMWALLADEFLVGGLLGGGTAIVGSNNQLPKEVIEARLETQSKVDADIADGKKINDLVEGLDFAATPQERIEIQEQLDAN